MRLSFPLTLAVEAGVFQVFFRYVDSESADQVSPQYGFYDVRFYGLIKDDVPWPFLKAGAAIAEVG